MKKMLSNEPDISKYDIEMFNLVKKYPLKKKKTKITALNQINLKIKKGEIFGLLGPNGAGKTTMVSILTTLIEPTSGYAYVLGHNILKNKSLIKRKIALMLGSTLIYYRMTGYKNLKYYAKLYGIKNYDAKINQLSKELNLENWINQYVEKYSSGMKTKLALARVLLTDPKILFLDEPMLGLDPIAIKSITDVLIGLNKTIFITSHQMNVVQKLCDRIAFINQGKILEVDTKENFTKLITGEINLEIALKSPYNLINSLKTLDFVKNIYNKDDKIYFSIQNEIFLPKLFEFLKDYPIISFNELKPSLEDIFIKLNPS